MPELTVSELTVAQGSDRSILSASVDTDDDGDDVTANTEQSQYTNIGWVQGTDVTVANPVPESETDTNLATVRELSETDTIEHPVMDSDASPEHFEGESDVSLGSESNSSIPELTVSGSDDDFEVVQ
jgi:hypothetical protein